MGRFNEMEAASAQLVRGPIARPTVGRAIAAVVLCVALVNTLGPALAAVAGPRRYAGLLLTELFCVAVPALWLARAGRHPAAWLFRLAPPRASLLAATLLMALSGCVLAGSIEAWTQRLFGPLPALNWQAYAPTSALEMPAALLAMAVAPAIAEELLYRGYVLRAFERVGSRPAVALLVGAMFSAAHLSPAAFPAHLFLGAAITFVVMSAGSIYPGMAFHAVVNGLTIVLWRSGVLEWLPGSLAANLAAASCFALGAVWVARGARRRDEPELWVPRP